MGWGVLSENGPFPESLQQVTLQTIDYEEPTCPVEESERSTQLCAGVPNHTKGYFSLVFVALIDFFCCYFL